MPSAAMMWALDLSVLLFFALGFPWWPCCCPSDPGGTDACNRCLPLTTPTTMLVTFDSGMDGNPPAGCTAQDCRDSWYGTHVLSGGISCIWTRLHEVCGGCRVGMQLFLTFSSLRLELTQEAGNPNCATQIARYAGSLPIGEPRNCLDLDVTATTFFTSWAECSPVDASIRIQSP